jgi:hypothetical protein
LRDVAERVRLIEQQASEFHRRSAHRETVIDRLVEENRELESAVNRSVLEPVAADLLRLYDALCREAARLRELRPIRLSLASSGASLSMSSSSSTGAASSRSPRLPGIRYGR